MGNRGNLPLCLCGWWVSIIALFVLSLLSHNSTASSSSSSSSSTAANKCVPSSCGDIHNISYPFRLQHDPHHCGRPDFTLECNDNIPVLRLFPDFPQAYYHVKAIDYDNSTIRLVDPGLDKNNCSSFPRFPFTDYSISGSSPWWSNNTAVTWLKCGNPVNSSGYVDTASCIKSKGYAYYAILGRMHVDEVEDGCTIDWMTLVDSYSQNVSYRHIHNQMVDYGFALHYFDDTEFRCPGGWSFDYVCYPHSIQGFLRLAWIRSFGFLLLALTLLFDFLHRFAVWIALGAIAVKLIFGGPFVIALFIYKWRKRHRSIFNNIEDLLEGNRFTPIRYSYHNIKKMSDGFKEKLGKGGFGTVFKAKLRSGRLGAIKLLGNSNANGEDFMSEVATIGRIHHVNVVQLVGYCVEGTKHALVYDFMPNGSLDKYIYSKEGSSTLSYKKIYKIAVGVAEGIEYLHQGCEMQILHFDIKPHNILLDENFVPKISDFGLAKLYPANNSIVSTMAARGTMGYIAPEMFYKNIGGVSYKADVYSFGMLLMEMASRRKNLNATVDHSSQIYFPSWVQDQYIDGNDLETGDATPEEKKLIKKMIITALWCIQMKPSDRPSMKRVTQMLVGDVESLELPPKPSLCTQPIHASNLDPVCSKVELTCTLSAR